MKRQNWISEIRKSVVGKRTRNFRRRIRRRALAIESLEQRNLLATVSFDAGAFDGGLGALTFQADAGRADDIAVTDSSLGPGFFSIQVDGDSIVLAGDAIGNENFQLSQTFTVDDTLTILFSNDLIGGASFDLGDLDDTFSLTIPFHSKSPDLFVVSGGDGSDTIDATQVGVPPTMTGGVTLIGGSGDDILIGGNSEDLISVSYTHLTLPTILLV